MSQAAAVKKLELTDENVQVLARFREQGSILGGTKEGGCQGFEIQLAIQSPEQETQLLDLIRQAHRMCFTEAVLTNAVAITSRHLINGRDVSGQV